MKNNYKILLIIIIGIIALYFTKVNYSDHSISKSISSCVIAQTKTKNISKEEAKKYCQKEINNKLGK